MGRSWVVSKALKLYNAPHSMQPRAYLGPGCPTGAPKMAQKWPKIAKMTKMGQNGPKWPKTKKNMSILKKTAKARRIQKFWPKMVKIDFWPENGPKRPKNREKDLCVFGPSGTRKKFFFSKNFFFLNHVWDGPGWFPRH